VVQRISERHRKPARRAETDYRRPGWYFVTVVTSYRHPYFGAIINGIDWLNEAGIAVEETWLKLPEHVHGIRMDEFMLMPNHLHGIIVIAPQSDPTQIPTLSDALRAFKSLSTNVYSKGVVERGWEPFEGHLWQRSFHDQIIRSAEHLERIRTYIANNPQNWESDEEHPNHNK
jgi:REP element-mobilizing transposase RayT